MPEIKALQEQRGSVAFSVLAINSGETEAQAAEFIEYIDAPFLYGLDIGLVLTDAYGVYGLPMSVFIDSTGVVQMTYRGHADRPRLERYTDAAITPNCPASFLSPCVRSRPFPASASSRYRPASRMSSWLRRGSCAAT